MMCCPHCESRSVTKHRASSKSRRTYLCQTCQNTFQKPANKAIWWAVGTLLVLGLSPWWLNRALQTIIARPNTSDSADAIVVLGRGPRYVENRTEAAVELWENGRAPQVFISGVTDAPVILKLAKDMGVPATHITGEACSRSTWENAFYTEMFMPPIESSSDKPKILLVTDDLHIARATLVYRSFGYEVLPHPVEVKFSMWRRHVFREFFVLLYYVARGWLLPPTAEDYRLAQIESESRIPDWQCDPATITTDN
ncbi:MAG: ElyC/SanA/YdcF family protein [Cyanobacteria bacterium P01_H01_bin.21]